MVEGSPELIGQFTAGKGNARIQRGLINARLGLSLGLSQRGQTAARSDIF